MTRERSDSLKAFFTSDKTFVSVNAGLIQAIKVNGSRGERQVSHYFRPNRGWTKIEDLGDLQIWKCCRHQFGLSPTTQCIDQPPASDVGQFGDTQ